MSFEKKLKIPLGGNLVFSFIKRFKWVLTLFLAINYLLTPGILKAVLYDQDLAAADKAFASKDEAKAKALYEKAAKEGSAEAHFALGYKFVLPDGEGLFHYVEAAKMGHAEALSYAIERLVFRADSLRRADPQKALALYDTAKKVNPNLKLFDEEGTVEILKRCAEPKGFDADVFIKKYGISKDEDSGYGIWELAEEASRGGRFGKPDPELVLNLVIRGSQVPAELGAAIKVVYANWKKGVVAPFDLCDYITSGMGQGYCAFREEKKAEAKRIARENAIIEKWPKDQQTAYGLLKTAADDFFITRSRNEVDLSGTGRAAFEIEEEDLLKKDFQKAISRFEKGKFPKFTSKDFKKSDFDLNDLYSRIMKLKDLQYGTVTPEEVKTVQLKWVPYREAWVKFGSLRYPSVSGDSWRTWLTKARMKQLEDLGSVLKRTANGAGKTASFYNPTSVAVDASGNVYVADMGNALIRKITPDGLVTTLAGGGSGHHTDGTGSDASFWNPWGIAVDKSGNVYVADSANYIVRKITREGLVTTLAGQSEVKGTKDGPVNTALFQNPLDVAVDPSGVVYVSDGGMIRKITTKGMVTTFPGSGGFEDYKYKPGTGQTTYYACNVAVDSFGNIYSSDGIFQIYKITPVGVVKTFAGSAGVTGTTDGLGTHASFNYPSEIAVDLSGNIYVADSENNKIRKIAPTGLVITLAGSGAKGFSDGKGDEATFYRPRGIAVDKVGNVYVADCNNLIRKITADGVVTTLAGSPNP